MVIQVREMVAVVVVVVDTPRVLPLPQCASALVWDSSANNQWCASNGNGEHTHTPHAYNLLHLFSICERVHVQSNWSLSVIVRYVPMYWKKVIALCVSSRRIHL